MKKQMIEIEVPDGKKAVWKDNKVIFEDIKPQLPKTWREFCKSYPIKRGEFLIDTSSQIVAPAWAARDMYATQNVLPSYKAAKAHLAYMQLHQLRNCYRQGWEPDWNDDNAKYSIFYDDKYWIGAYNSLRHFLSFQTREIAEEFLHNFRDLIEQAGDLI